MNDSNNLVEDYGWASAQGPGSCNYITPRILTLLKELQVRRAIDVGAGNGNLCSQISDAGYEVAGVECDRQGFEIAQSTYPQIPFYNYGVQDNPQHILAQESVFDAVISTEVVEHLFSPHLLPIYANGLLKDQGYLIISTPYHGYLKNLAIALTNKWDSHHTALWHGGHIKFWSRATLSKLLEENGFKIINFSGVGRFPYFWKSMILVGQKR